MHTHIVTSHFLEAALAISLVERHLLGLVAHQQGHGTLAFDLVRDEFIRPNFR